MDPTNTNLNIPDECKQHFFFDNILTADVAENAAYQKCADWLVPYIATHCNADVNSCRALVQDQPAHFKTLNEALPNKFCQYPDDSCKRKIRNKTQDEMSVIGTIGCVFLIFFTVIIYMTQRGVKSYMFGDYVEDEDGENDGGGGGEE